MKRAFLQLMEGTEGAREENRCGLSERAERRLTWTSLLAPRFYTLSIILGTVALSYGSVPMYKMV